MLLAKLNKNLYQKKSFKDLTGELGLVLAKSFFSN